MAGIHRSHSTTSQMSYVLLLHFLTENGRGALFAFRSRLAIGGESSSGSASVFDRQHFDRQTSSFNGHEPIRRFTATQLDRVFQPT